MPILAAAGAAVSGVKAVVGLFSSGKKPPITAAEAAVEAPRYGMTGGEWQSIGAGWRVLARGRGWPTSEMFAKVGIPIDKIDERAVAAHKAGYPIIDRDLPAWYKAELSGGVSTPEKAAGTAQAMLGTLGTTPMLVMIGLVLIGALILIFTGKKG